jgi:alpha-ketoglutaric semialdehyde dehydrogenase
MNTNVSKVLIAGEWRESQSSSTFQAENPSTGELLPTAYPVSSREEVMAALRAGAEAAEQLRIVEPEAVAKFLEACAAGMEARAGELVDMAHSETALPKTPRLKDVELPRTTNQLRLAALAAREGSWQRPVRDEAAKIYSVFAPLGGRIIFHLHSIPRPAVTSPPPSPRATLSSPRPTPVIRAQHASSLKSRSKRRGMAECQPQPYK